LNNVRNRALICFCEALT